MLLDDAVDAKADVDVLVVRNQVDVARARLDRAAHDVVDRANGRRVAEHVALEVQLVLAKRAAGDELVEEPGDLLASERPRRRRALCSHAAALRRLRTAGSASATCTTPSPSSYGSATSRSSSSSGSDADRGGVERAPREVDIRQAVRLGERAGADYCETVRHSVSARTRDSSSCGLNGFVT